MTKAKKTVKNLSKTQKSNSNLTKRLTAVGRVAKNRGQGLTAVSYRLSVGKVAKSRGQGRTIKVSNYNGGLKGYESDVLNAVRSGSSQMNIAIRYSDIMNRWITRDQVRHLVEVAREQGINV